MIIKHREREREREQRCGHGTRANANDINDEYDPYAARLRDGDDGDGGGRLVCAGLDGGRLMVSAEMANYAQGRLLCDGPRFRDVDRVWR